MLHYAVVFFVIALIAAVFGFGGIAAGAVGIAKTLFFIFLILRVAFLLAALAVGLLIGLLVAGRIPMGRDRFGGVIYRNRGRYLAFWLGTFSLCGLFRLLPWGFVTYWTIWFLLLGASLALTVHWRLYARYRALRLRPSPGLPPGEPLDLSLSAREAVLLSTLLRQKGPADARSLARSLTQPDPVLLAHPAVAWAQVRGRKAPIVGHMVTADVVLVPEATAGTEELATWCAARLPEYAVPRRLKILAQIPIKESLKSDV